MKKVTLSINGHISNENAADISGALNDLSGVVAADTTPSENKAYAYSGDRLSKSVLEDAVRKTGYDGRVVNEEYLKGL